MNIEQSKAVTAWLLTLDGITKADPVSVQIGQVTYWGAYYEQQNEYTGTMMAVTHGDKKEGDTYINQRYYLLAKNRPSHKRKTVYRIEGQSHEWFVSGWYDERHSPDFAHLHPFGSYFQLGNWTHEEPIDRYEPSPRYRMTILVTRL